MAIEYKPTKPKKEKQAKAPKAPKAQKAEKPVKIGAVQKVKTTKPKKEKPVKAPKAPKPEKAKAFSINKKETVQAEKPINQEQKNSFQIKPKKEKKLGIEGKGKKEKKEFSFSLKDKKTRIIFISLIAVILVLAAVLTVVILKNKEGNEPVNIYVSEFPKLSYYVGEDADFTGMTIAIVKKNGKADYVKYTKGNAADFIIKGFNSTRPYEDQVISVSYNNMSCQYHIAIKEMPEPVRELVGISIDTLPNKTEYKVGEWIDTEGGILLLEYSDGTTERTIMVNNYISDGWDEAREAGPGTYTITVKYKDRDTGIVKRTTYDITISPATE